MALFACSLWAKEPSSWTDAELAWARSHPRIVVGTFDEGYPPFERLQNGALIGLAPDYLTAILKPLGITWTVHVYSSSSALLAAAKRGEVDVVMNVSTRDRDIAPLRVGAPYFASSAVAVVRRDDIQAAQVEQLSRGRIVVRDAYMETDALRQAFPHATMLYASTIPEALAMVVDKRANAYVEDRNTVEDSPERARLKDVLTTGGEFPWSRNTLSFAVPPNEAVLGDLIDKGLSDIDVDEAARLRLRWLGKGLTGDDGHNSPQLTHEERAWLDALPPLKVAIDPSFVPFNVVSPAGKIEGLSADYLKFVAKDLNIKLEAFPSNNWSETLDSIKRGNVDLLGTMNPEGRAAPYMTASANYISFPTMLVVREGAPPLTDIEDLNGKTLLANPDRAADTAILAELQDVKLIPIGSAEEGMRRLAAGEGDALVCNLASADYLISKKYAGVLKIAAPTGESEALTIGVRKGLEPLVPLINRSLNRLTPRERQTMKNTWFAADYHYGASWREIIRRFLPILAAVLSFLVVLILAYIKLRREVHRRRLVEAQLDEVVDNLPAVVFKLVRHSDGRRRFTYLGGDPEPVIGMSASEILNDESPVLHTVHEDDRAMLREELDRSAHNLSPLRLTIRATVRGVVHYVKSQAKPHRNPDGSTYWSGFWSDVTHEHDQSRALALARDTAEDATRAKSEFLATMSHEIRTPMNGVIGTLGVLSRTNLDRQQKHLLGTVSNSAEALLHILNDILDYSKIESGEMQLDPDEVDLRQLLDSVTSVMANPAHEKGLLLRTRVARDVSTSVMADEGRLRQILFNLLSNAIKFTNDGVITVNLDALDAGSPRQTLRFSVRDTGVGISESAQKDIFRPFFQADAAVAHQFGGTGLGLSICRRLSELMGGQMSLESSPGTGTLVTATLALPVVTTKPRSIRSDVPLHLLVDQPDVRQALTDFLLALGEEVSAELPPKNSHSLVFCDRPDSPTTWVQVSDDVMPEGFRIDAERVCLSANPLQLSAIRWIVENRLGPHGDGPIASVRKEADSVAPRRPSWDRKHALVVDDHRTNREVLTLMLNEQGISADTAENGVEALTLLAERAYDIVFSDCHMPIMDGYAMTLDLRSSKNALNRSVPIVAVTADVRPTQWSICREAGMNDLLSKPIVADVLEGLLRKWLPLDNQEGSLPFELDLDHLRKRFGTDKVIEKVLTGCIEETTAAFNRLRTMPEAPSGTELGDWLHHVLGGMSFVMQGPLIDQGRSIEISLYEHGELRHELPADLMTGLRKALAAMTQLHGTLETD